MFLAHISEDQLREQSISDHLHGTAKLAGDFAEVFRCREWGYGCGLLHDIGKFSAAFQKRLHGGSITDHATAGAKELFQRKNYIGAYCVSGHHSGLLDGGSPADSAGEATLMGRMKKEVEDYRPYQDEITFPAFSNVPLKPLGKGGFSLSFFIRMLFSCLVDADYLDTEAFMSDGAVERGRYDSMETLSERLDAYVAPWLFNTDSDTVNGRRSLILRACMERAEEEQGLFRLTVPTGGGKTVSSLAFALRHAKKHHLERIIYVIPYTSIIEQNAQVFREILGKENVLEDHSNVTCENAQELEHSQLAAENWDRPVVVTTNVQFFESLFSNKTSKCRKLHNISNSVILFDEAQMLPVPFLKPCIRAISELSVNYHSTAVLCTATQPALEDFFPEQRKMVELCPDVKGQYEFFRRTTFTQVGEWTEAELVDTLKRRTQALCILNSRGRVQRVYEAMRGEGVYHLSTFMYPLHRKRLLALIRERLKAGKPCTLIATSLVEAGVDFDFQSVFREFAGLDSMIQAAGRCNREGKRPVDECETVLFKLERDEAFHLPQELKIPIAVAEQTAENWSDLTSPEAVADYFNRLYHLKGEELDHRRIVEQFEQGTRSLMFPFASVAEQFHLIEDQTKTILIDREPEAAALVERIRRGEHSRQLLREAGQFGVNVFEKDFDNLYGAGRLEPMDMGLYVLRNRDQYTEEEGLVVGVERGDGLFI